nr:MAG TPA: 7-carboxy-7-deazaguanine synthase [Caudoviricetes sp.]
MLVRFQTVPFSWEGWAGKRFVRFEHRQCSLRCGECAG